MKNDRDPRRDPIPGDELRIGRRCFLVLPVRWKHHVHFRHPQGGQRVSHGIPLWAWRRMMSDPESIVVTQTTCEEDK